MRSRPKPQQPSPEPDPQWVQYRQAIRERDTKSLLALLDTVTDPVKKHSMGQSALHLAAYEGRSEMAVALLNYGVDPHMVEGRTEWDVTPLILNLGLPVNDHSRYSNALTEAVNKGE
jgi:hypothetical protein